MPERWTFQSTLPRRERRSFAHRKEIARAFQSTLPRRERHTLPVPFRTLKFDFNPRSREGSDAVCAMMGNMWVISIHAPAKGATRNTLVKRKAEGISIHAPAKGATFNTSSERNVLLFQSTLPRRERRLPGLEVLRPA